MKIKIFSHKPANEKNMAFTDVIKFVISLDDSPNLDEYDMNKDAEQQLKELCAWCCESFKHNFVIIEHVSARIVGGWVDNSKGWKHQGKRVRRDDYAWQSKYELRCMSADATWFKMKLA
jgi:hypothetical protein